MKENDVRLDRFINSLSGRCAALKDQINQGVGSWDSRARKALANNLPNWFSQDFGITENRIKEFVCVEGWNKIPGERRGKPFLGTQIHPDAAIFIGHGGPSVAIELDHGAKGSQIRNALAKASFAVTLGAFDKAVLLFFWEGNSLESFPEDKESEGVRQMFYNNFHTVIFFV